MKNILLVLLLFASTSLWSQSLSLSGKIVDADAQPLPGAHVSLQYPWDEEVEATFTDSEGIFTFKEIEKGGYKIKVSYIGYEDQFKEIVLQEQSVDLGTLIMQEGAVELQQIEVTERVPAATQKGDTTQFDAKAYKTLPDANSEDLISKMPGVIVQNGKVQAQGEDVKEILVDGKPFFGNDPTTALRTLPAEVVDKIQVFDQTSDQAQFSGFNDGETTKTINIITKPDSRRGQFGKIYAGYGYEDKYQAGGNTSFFNGDQRISIIGQTNNINQQNFATEDLLGVVGSSGRRGRGRGGWGRGGSVNDFLVDQQGGIAQTHALGINYSDEWGEKFEVTGSYFFNITDNNARDTLTREFIDNEEVSEIYSEGDSSNTQNINHRFNFRLEYEIDSMNSIIMRPRLSLQYNEGVSSSFGGTRLDEMILNLTDNEYRTNLSGIDFYNYMLFRHRFARRGRTFSLRLRTSYNNNQGESFLFSENLYNGDVTTLETLDQFSNLDIKGWNHSAEASYTEPIGENASLMVEYEYTWRPEDSDKRTFDFSEQTNDYTELNEPLTNVFANDFYSHRVSTGYNYRKGRDFFFIARMALEQSALNSNQSFPTEQTVERTYTNLLPFAMLRYNISRMENLRVFYRTNTNLPDVNQLQNVIDNSNPTQLSIGNPALDQSFTHRFFTRYSKTNTDKSRVFYLYASASYTLNNISNSVYLSENDDPLFDDFILQPGAQITQPVNLDNRWDIRTFLTYGIPVKFIKSNLNFDLSVNYARVPGLIDDRLNYSNNETYSAGVSITSNISDRVDFTISTRPSYNNARNTLETRSNLNSSFWNQNSRFKLDWILPAGFVFRTDLTHQYYDGLSEGFDQNFFLWNLGIGKKLFKNQLGELTLSAYDLLNQNQSVRRNVTEVYIEDVQTNILQQFFMLTFTYNFRNFNVGEGIPQDNRDSWGSPPHSRGGH